MGHQAAICKPPGPFAAPRCAPLGLALHHLDVGAREVGRDRRGKTDANRVALHVRGVLDDDVRGALAEC
eukprot:2068143-Prymnesium_polylepis.1